MIRTIEEMERDDKICPGSAISDVLAFCIVAGDFLRAKRKRFPLAKFINNYDEINMDESTTYNHHRDLETIINDRVCAIGDTVCFCYFNTDTFDSFMDPYYLWDYNIEYLEEDP